MGVVEILRAAREVASELDHLCHAIDQATARLDVLGTKLPLAIQRLQESAAAAKAVVDGGETAKRICTRPKGGLPIVDVPNGAARDAEFRRVHEQSPTVAAVQARQMIEGEE